MHLVIGLGNPGKNYAQTRHNIGWVALVAVEARGQFAGLHKRGVMEEREGTINGEQYVTIRPQTYMNASGQAGKVALKRWKATPRDVIVIHDDLDLPFGRIRIRTGGSSGGQRGVASMIESFGSPAFTRIRVGIGRPPEGMDPVDYVLDRFAEDEWPQLGDVVERVADAVIAIVGDGVERAMTTYNKVPQ